MKRYVLNEKICVCVYVYIYIYIDIDIDTYACVYINTYIHKRYAFQLNHASTAANPNPVAYFNFGVRSDRCSMFSALGRRRLICLVVSYHCFMLEKENCLSSAMVKCW